MPHRPFRRIPTLVEGLCGCCLLAILIAAQIGCSKQESENAARTGESSDSAAPPSGNTAEDAASVFRDVTDEVGLRFTHFTGASGKYYMPEIMGAGVGLLDYDRDGDLDVYLLQGGMVMPEDDPAQALFPSSEQPPFRNRLFRNELISNGRRGPLRFTDVTDASGAGDTGYGMGCAIADYDNDGDPDIYVTNFGSNALYRNNGDGTFTNVTADAGVDDSRWSTSAAWGDFDNDGWLDLAVVNYVAFIEDVNKVCRRPAGDRDYCTPLAYAPQPDSLFRNNGDGTFTDITAAAGLTRVYGNGLGVIWSDFDGDNRLDLYVANDGVANQLWQNRGDGTFEDIGPISGTALNEAGKAEAGMGVAVADYDHNGHEDIFVTHLFGETNTLYVNAGKAVFTDRTSRSGLGAPSRTSTGFGTSFFDYDRDGVLDIYVVNGGVAKVDQQVGDPYPYLMPNQLFRGLSGGRFEDVSQQAGAAFALLESSRGSALGDLDLDGDLDLVYSNNNGPARVLVNQLSNANHWLAVRLNSAGLNRDGIGATIHVSRATGPIHFERMRTDGSYCSSRDPSVWFGLGSRAEPVDVTVHWLTGLRERWTSVSVDQVVTLRHGEGTIIK